MKAARLLRTGSVVLMLGSNLKVHFAGADNSIAHLIARDLAEVNYVLFTCYPFINKKKLYSNFNMVDSGKFVP